MLLTSFGPEGEALLLLALLSLQVSSLVMVAVQHSLQRTQGVHGKTSEKGLFE
jgi:hypothetical protein